MIRRESDVDGDEEENADGVIDSVTRYAYTDVAVDWGSILDVEHRYEKK